MNTIPISPEKGNPKSTSDPPENEPHGAAQRPEALLSEAFLSTLVQSLRGELETIKRELKALRRQHAPDGPDALLTRQEAADVLGISVRKLDDLAEAGRLRPVRIDRAVRYHPGTLERFVRRCTEEERS
jgi:excisionase family DNA binding protein